MKHRFSCHQRTLVLLLSGFLWATAGAQQPGEAAVHRVRGQIISLDGTDLQMRAETGQNLHVKLVNGYSVGAVSRGDLSRITTGAYIGVAAMPQPDGSLEAFDVYVFPESMRGTSEGHRPMNGTGATMTNAAVSRVDTIDNTATFSAVSTNGPQHKITVKYASGEKVVLLQADTPVFMVEPARREMLASGVNIVLSVTVQLDGSFSGDRVTVGVNGAVPPL
jgi:hypothetical protein